MNHRDPQTYEIIGAAMEAYNELKSGFLEAGYQDAMEYEFKLRNIPYSKEHPIPVIDKRHKLGNSYRADFSALKP